MMKWLVIPRRRPFRAPGTGGKGHPELVVVVIPELIAGPALKFAAGGKAAAESEFSLTGGYCILPQPPL